MATTRTERFEAVQPILRFLEEVNLMGWGDRMTYRIAAGDFDRALHYCSNAAAAALSLLEDSLDADARDSNEAMRQQLENLEQIRRLELLLQRQRHRLRVRSARATAAASGSAFRPRTLPFNY